MEETGPKPHPAPLKHKPSPRHTLEEVLRSLQDMVRNELGEAGQRPAAPEPAALPAGATPRDIEAGLRTVLDTLGPRTGNAPITEPVTPEPTPAELAPFVLEPSPPAAPSAPAVVLAAEPPPANQPDEPAAQPDLPLMEAVPDPEPAAPEEPPFIPMEAGSPVDEELPADEESIDIEFTGTDEVDEPASEDEPMPENDRLHEEEPPEDIADIGPDSQETAAAEMADEVAPQPGETGEEDAQFIDTGSPDDQPNWEDVPVLEDAVYVPSEPREGRKPEREPATTEPPEDPRAPVQLEVPLPSAEGAREIAIRTAARLNIELKRSGRRGLSNDVIIRLTRILRDSLAQAGTNVDNTGPKE